MSDQTRPDQQKVPEIRPVQAEARGTREMTSAILAAEIRVAEILHADPCDHNPDPGHDSR
jgi:hypothetical protein